VDKAEDLKPHPTGFKELHVHSTLATPSEASFNDAVQRMKQSTRRYAKRQISWIRNKLLPAAHAVNLEGPLVAVYLLDGTSKHFACIRAQAHDNGRSRDLEFGSLRYSSKHPGE
jgi:tRNA A37 N6-isopentenylltransferase MiaA